MMQLEKNILAHSNFKYRFAEKTPGSRRPFSELVHSNVSDLFECSFLRVDTDHKVTVGPRLMTSLMIGAMISAPFGQYRRTNVGID